MKGTEKIIAHIQSDAKAQADAILAQSEQQCAAIREDYENRAREAYTARIREGVKACEESIESRSRISQMENKKDLLSLKQEMVSAVFDRAKEMILSMPEAEYCSFLTALAVKSADCGTGEVILNAADRERFGDAVVKAANEKLGGNLTLSGEVGDFAGGLIVRNERIEVNSTLELLINLCRGEMSSQVAKALFE